MPLTKALRDQILAENERMTTQSLRCLAVAFKESNLGSLDNYDGALP